MAIVKPRLAERERHDINSTIQAYPRSFSKEGPLMTAFMHSIVSGCNSHDLSPMSYVTTIGSPPAFKSDCSTIWIDSLANQIYEFVLRAQILAGCRR